uniref:Uncharacterized protein n=1 Tax=Arundo donax TaxID=35708 RepID=A0A0A9D582_ARUDO
MAPSAPNASLRAFCLSSGPGAGPRSSPVKYRPRPRFTTCSSQPTTTSAAMCSLRNHSDITRGALVTTTFLRVGSHRRSYTTALSASM